jgi:hypothetical protein
MPSLKDYFDQNAYKPKFNLGDRVEGQWKGIPFVGSVGNDTLISEEQGPRVSILLDLPILHEGKVHHIITLKAKDLKKRK